MSQDTPTHCNALRSSAVATDTVSASPPYVSTSGWTAHWVACSLKGYPEASASIHGNPCPLNLQFPSLAGLYSSRPLSSNVKITGVSGRESKARHPAIVSTAAEKWWPQVACHSDHVVFGAIKGPYRLYTCLYDRKDAHSSKLQISWEKSIYTQEEIDRQTDRRMVGYQMARKEHIVCCSINQSFVDKH